MIVYQLSVFLHILSAIVWIGGILFLALVVVPAMRGLPPAERAALSGAVGRRFRTVGWACIGVVVVMVRLSVYHDVVIGPRSVEIPKQAGSEAAPDLLAEACRLRA
jgi:uncharacterized membrane protein